MQLPESRISFASPDDVGQRERQRSAQERGPSRAHQHKGTTSTLFASSACSSHPPYSRSSPPRARRSSSRSSATQSSASSRAPMQVKSGKTSPPSGRLYISCPELWLIGNPNRFLYDGNRLNEDDTPSTLDMEEGDTIDVMVERASTQRSFVARAYPMSCAQRSEVVYKQQPPILVARPFHCIIVVHLSRLAVARSTERIHAFPFALL